MLQSNVSLDDEAIAYARKRWTELYVEDEWKDIPVLDKPISRKEARQAWIERQLQHIKDEEGMGEESMGGWSRSIIQQCPYTCVGVTVVVYGLPEPLQGVGFSKVKWPDKWDADIGVEIATKKAIANCWKSVFCDQTQKEG